MPSMPPRNEMLNTLGAVLLNQVANRTATDHEMMALTRYMRTIFTRMLDVELYMLMTQVAEDQWGMFDAHFNKGQSGYRRHMEQHGHVVGKPGEPEYQRSKLAKTATLIASIQDAQKRSEAETPAPESPGDALMRHAMQASAQGEEVS